MANDTQKSFPMLPVKHWWALREKFKQSIPGTVTDNYLSTSLNIQPRSARNNVLPYLKDFGLIDDDGKTQDLAKAWRDDNQYQHVCKTIVENLYPGDLISAVPNPSQDRASTERWFANHTGAGGSAVRRMAAIYVVISEADMLTKPQIKTKGKKGRKTSAKRNKISPVSHTTKDSTPTKYSQSPASVPGLPGVSINLQIHISSDASPDQIDRIFESMAKHIYKK